MSLRTLSVVVAVLLLAACSHLPTHPISGAPVERKEQAKDYYRQLPPGAHALRKLSPADWPDFGPQIRERETLIEACSRSLNYLGKPSAKQFFPMSGIAQPQVVESVTAFRELLMSSKTDAEVLASLKADFDLYQSVGCDDKGTVLFTGYYTPEFPASMTRTGRFQYPLHALPPNHVKDPITGKTLGRKQADGSVDPHYPSRDELLSSGELDGLELVYLDSAFAAYVVGVQGSAFLRMENGSVMEVGYAGSNGRDYASIGKALIKAGKLEMKDLNLRNLIRYFDEHPEEFAPLAAKNERYVFFQPGDGGPFGCLNEKVSALASIATDKTIFPRGAVCFLQTTLPVGEGTYKGWVLDQDSGGAIRAPGRCDVYMGIGDEAGELAGHTYAEGQLFYLLAKSSAEVAKR